MKESEESEKLTFFQELIVWNHIRRKSRFCIREADLQNRGARSEKCVGPGSQRKGINPVEEIKIVFRV